MTEVREITTGCLHCAVSELLIAYRDVQQRGGRPDNPEKIVSNLLQVVAEFVESAPEPYRTELRLTAALMLPGLLTEARKEFDAADARKSDDGRRH